MPRTRLQSPKSARYGSPILFILFILSNLSSCTGAEARMLAQPVIDTLPGGIERVISPGPTSWEGTGGWQLELVHEVTAEEGTPGELINPQSLALDDWGRVFVVDQKPAVIKVYGVDGQFIRTIGGEGAGPGEFRVGFVAVHEGMVVLQDPQTTRTTVWDTTGTMVRNWSSSCCYWSDIQVDRQGLVYIPSVLQRGSGEERRPGTPYVRWTLEGVVHDTVWVPEASGQTKIWTVTAGEGSTNRMMMSTSVPLSPRLVMGYHPAGGFLVGWSESYQIARSPDGSDTLQVFGRGWSPEPVTAARKQAEVDAMVNRLKDPYGEEVLRKSFKVEDIPNQAPAFLALHVDRNGNRWVRLDPGLDTTRTRFDIYDEQGVLLGALAVSPALPMYGRLVFGRDELVVARENADGIPVVARYRVRK